MSSPLKSENCKLPTAPPSAAPRRGGWIETQADALVLIASARRIPGGKFVEAGVALGQGKSVYILGHRENMLLFHPLATAFDSCESMLESLEAGA